MKIFENTYMTAWMEGEIYIGVYKKNLLIGLEAAVETVRLRKEITQNQPIRGLLFISNLKAISEEAKKYFASEEALENVEKFALVSDSVFTMLIANTYLKLVPPKVPSKMFTNKEDALKWLKAD